MRRPAIIAGRAFIGVIWLMFIMCCALVLFIFWYRWDSGTNRGLSFGYYGDFNRVRHALGVTPGVHVSGDYANKDMVMEEFGFHIVTASHGEQVLHVSESDSLRSLGEAESKAEVRRRLGLE